MSLKNKFEEFQETWIATKQKLVDRLHDFGMSSASMDMGWTSLLTISQGTNLTIDVPLNLVYSDEFIISGILQTSTYSRISDKTVKLKVGDTVVDTTTTNNNGEYSFTRTPVSIGNHSFQVIFEGNSIHGSSESAVITREVGKETSVLNARSQDSLVIVTLCDDDGEYIKNASVKIYENDNLLTTQTTSNTGTFSCSFNHNKKLKFVYDGDSNYTSCTLNYDYILFDGINLSSDKSVLSSADNESATLTAQLLKEGNPISVSGKSINFEVYDDDENLLETLTATTDSDGVASVSYLGIGTGDIYIKASVGDVSSEKTYIEDMIKCYKLDGSESFKQITGTTTISDGVMTGGCGFITSDLIDNSKDWELRFDGAYSHASSAFDICDSTIATRDRKCLKMALNGNFVEYNASGGYNEIKWTVPSINTYHKFILRKQNGTFTLTVDETTYSKASSYLSANSVNIAVGLDYWGSGSCSIKNIRYIYL